MRNLFFVDAETDGLYGQFISVAVIITDSQLNIIEEQYYGIRKDLLKISDSWVKENVVPILGEYDEFDTEEELLEQVWKLWMKYRNDAYAIADVAYPVEMRLFEECVMKDRASRCYDGPFPLLDLSSILYAKGYQPEIERKRLLDNPYTIEQHNAFDDVKMSIEIYRKLLLQ